MNATASSGSNCAARDELRDDADVAAPVGAGRVDGDLDADVEPAAPALELLAEEQVVGRPAAVEDDELAEVVAVRERVVDRRTERRQADAAADDDEVVAARGVDRPAVPERPAHADDVARRAGAERLRHRADRADRVHERRARLRHVAARRDRHLADAEGVEHGELARPDRIDRTRRPARARASSCRGSRAVSARRGTAAASSRRVAAVTSLTAVAIDVHQLEARGLETGDEHLREAVEQVVAERGIVLALARGGRRRRTGRRGRRRPRVP